MSEKIEKNIEELIEDLEELLREENAQDDSNHPIAQLIDGCRQLKNQAFYPLEEEADWINAMNIAVKCKNRAMGEQSGKLEGEKLVKFELFLKDMEELVEELAFEFPKAVIEQRGPGFPWGEIKDLEVEANCIFNTDDETREVGDLILRQLLYRYLTKDHQFFGELSRRMDIQGNKNDRQRKLPDKASGAFFAFKLGMELGRNPTREEILEELKNQGIEPSDRTKFFKECGLGFIPKRKRGPKKKESEK